jgi:hypothetical protein
MPHSDAAAVALARDGDSEAFRALVERHSRAVFRVAHRMTGSAQDAEDVVQETFLRAYRQLARFESRATFSTVAAPDRGELLDRPDSVAPPPGSGSRCHGPGAARSRPRNAQCGRRLAGAADAQHRGPRPGGAPRWPLLELRSQKSEVRMFVGGAAARMTELARAVRLPPSCCSPQHGGGAAAEEHERPGDRCPGGRLPGGDVRGVRPADSAALLDPR